MPGGQCGAADLNLDQAVKYQHDAIGRFSLGHDRRAGPDLRWFRPRTEAAAHDIPGQAAFQRGRRLRGEYGVFLATPGRAAWSAGGEPGSPHPIAPVKEKLPQSDPNPA